MTMVSLSTTITCCAASAAIGYVVSLVMGRLRRSRIPVPAAEEFGDRAQDSRDAQAAAKERKIKQLVDSLYKLTNQVDSQVGEHSLRVNEITNTLDESEATGSSFVVAAGRLLVNANQKLQSELEEARSEIQRQREQTNACMMESRTDALTNLANRRAFDLEIARAFADRRANGHPLSLLIIDVDHFKRINDKYGHMVGDRLLKAFSRCLLNTFRDTDFVARYGGEEFVAIMPKSPLQEALKAAERVRMAIAESHFRVGEIEMQITASFGVKEVADHESEAELMEKADSAMYAAKRGGRNRCYYHDGTTYYPYVPVVDPNSLPQNPDPAPKSESGSETLLEADATSAVIPAWISARNLQQTPTELQVSV